jgi:nucleoid-associated protein YgaU
LLVPLALLLIIGFGIGSAYAADKMTYEDYQVQLQGYKDRETKALDAMAAERAAIDGLRARIKEVEGQIKATWDEIYALLGVTAEQVRAFLDQIAILEGKVDELAKLSPEMLLDRAKEIDERAEDVKRMQANPIALLSEPRERLNRLATRLDALKRSLPKPKHEMYRVLRGDYLWKISGKREIFDDPFKWMRIYSANRDEIKNPDLIHPEQMLRIPRQFGRDEYLVVRGDFLRKISGYAQVYGDPFQWTKIYQANKTIINDPNLIYPEQILLIPRN